MAEFNSDGSGSAPPNNQPGGNPDSSSQNLSGPDKLKSLLEQSRAVAAGDASGEFEDEATALTSVPPDASTSGEVPERTSPDHMTPAAMSGQTPAARSGEMPAARSGPMPAARSGERPAAPSGPVPTPDGSGQVPPQQFQMNPNASYSGPLPASMQSGMMANPYDSQSVPLAPSGEFGVVPDIGVSQSQEVPQSEAPSAKKRRVRAVGVTTLIGVVAFFIVARLIVDQWVSPGRAVIWMAAGTFIPTALVGIILAWPNRENGSIKDTLSGLIPAIAVSAAAVVLAGSWSQGAIRVQAVQYTPMTPALMATILDDEAEEVAVAGCERFGARYDDTDFRTRLFSILTLRPSLAMSCMDKLPDDASFAIATSLSDRWTRELLADEKNPDKQRLCATAGGLSSLKLEPAQIRGRLLQCTLNAPNEIAQQCCADSLGTTVVDPKQWAKHLRETIPFARDPYTSTGVFAMAFHQEGLTKPQQEFAKKVNFQSPQAQLASLEFACDAIGNGSANVVRHMQAALDGECPVDAGNVPSNEAVWQEICFLTITEIEADRTRPPVATMCAMTRDVVTGLAVETANNLVTLALRRDFKGSLSKQIEGGYNLLLENLVDPNNPNRTETPDFVDANDLNRARAEREMGSPDSHNLEFKTPGDDNFQAFLKAYREKQPWKERKVALEREKKKKEAEKK